MNPVDTGTNPVYTRYRTKFREFLKELASMPLQGFDEVVRVLEESSEPELAAIYVSMISRTAGLWLVWEDYCRSASSEFMGLCRDIEAAISESGTRIGGVSSFFNSSLKKLLVKMHADLSPGIVVPAWIITYSSFTGDKVVLHLAGLHPSEQLRRLPYFVAALGTLDAILKAYLDYYLTKGSDFAYITAEYIYWEVVKPTTLFFDAVVDELSCGKCINTRKDLYELVLSALEENDTEPPHLSPKVYIASLSREVQRVLYRRLSSERLRMLRIG
jgi:hypothetical protein